MITKRCSRCKQELPITIFSNNKKNADGYSFYCKQCRNISQRIYRKNHIPREITKYKAGYICQECGSAINIQAHHKKRGDDNSLICLCAECHSKRHPKNMHNFITAPKCCRSYWENKSLYAVSKEAGVSASTIIRVARKLSIRKGILSSDDELAIKHSLRRITNTGIRTRTSIDYDRLALEIRNMNDTKKLFHILKTELQSLGYWRNHPRGNPKLGYLKSKHLKE